MESELKKVLEDPKGPYVLECCARAPYSGCWHEQNYWFLKDHKVYPLYISGVAWDRFDFRNYNKPWMAGTHFMKFLHSMEEMEDHYNEWELIQLEDWELGNYNVLNSVTAILMQHQVPLPKWECKTCGATCVGLAKFLGYRGNGGIGVLLEDPCCSSCFGRIKWCERCGYVEPGVLGFCPDLEDDPDGGDDCRHELCDPTDEAEQFGLTGMKFLGPDGDVEGLEGVSIVIMQKGG